MVKNFLSLITVIVLLVASVGEVGAQQVAKADVPVTDNLVYRETVNAQIVLFDTAKGLAVPMDASYIAKLDQSDGDFWYSLTKYTTTLPEGSMIYLETVKGDLYRCRVNFEKTYVWDVYTQSWKLEWQGCLVTLALKMQKYEWSAAKDNFVEVPGQYWTDYHTFNASPNAGRMPIKLAVGDKVSYFDASGKKVMMDCGSWVVLERPDCKVAK